MSYSVYIIYSTKLNKYYIGYSGDITTRMKQHNTKSSTYTSKANDWELKYTEKFDNREDAHKRELEIKHKKSRRYIEWLIKTDS
jgi:putative endonuclease